MISGASHSIQRDINNLALGSPWPAHPWLTLLIDHGTLSHWVWYNSNAPQNSKQSLLLDQRQHLKNLLSAALGSAHWNCPQEYFSLDMANHKDLSLRLIHSINHGAVSMSCLKLNPTSLILRLDATSSEKHPLEPPL